MGVKEGAKWELKKRLKMGLKEGGGKMSVGEQIQRSTEE